VRSLYDELGVAPSADQEQLRRAFRRRARELHPDVNDDVDDDSAMQRLNAAWAVLGDPTARLRYDQELHDAVPPTAGTPAPVERIRDDPASLPTAVGWLRLVRPSVIIPVVLFLIFVVTAFAGQPGSGGTAPAPRPTMPSGQQGTSQHGAATPITPVVTVPASSYVGRCIRDESGPVLLVPCSERPNSLVIATVPASGNCPSGTSGYLVAGQDQMVCADPTSR
jgi:curved DNA-binding protein CbpA